MRSQRTRHNRAQPVEAVSETPGRARWWWFPVCGGAYALLTILSFPPVGLWWLSLVALAPLGLAGSLACGRARLSCLLVLLGVLPLWIWTHRWLIDVTLPGYPLLCVYLSAYPAVFVGLCCLVRRWGVRDPGWLWVWMPVLWTGMEYLRGEVAFTGYPWYQAQHPLVAFGLLSSAGSIVGAYGVLLLLAGITFGLIGVARSRGRARVLPAGVAVVSFGIWTTLSTIGMARSPSEPVDRTALIVALQTNVPQDNRMGWAPEQRLRDFRDFVGLSRDAHTAHPHADLIVWPETMFPGEALNRTAVEALRKQDPFPVIDASGRRLGLTELFVDRLLALQTELGTPMLVGAKAVEGDPFRYTDDGRIEYSDAPRYNSVFVIQDGTVAQNRYDKVSLTPFGEIMPYVWRVPWLENAMLAIGAGGMRFDLSGGVDLDPLTVAAPREQDHPLRVATPICFEVTKSWVCRAMVYNDGSRRADVLVNVSNDGWFGNTSVGRHAHLLCARWRCVELGVPAVRSVNTGVSAIIDARGQVLDSTGINAPGYVAEHVAITRPDRGTIFGRVGDIAGWASLTSAALLVGWSCVRKVRQRPRTPVDVPESDRPI